jgi:hypothetical protein
MSDLTTLKEMLSRIEARFSDWKLKDYSAEEDAPAQKAGHTLCVGSEDDGPYASFEFDTKGKLRDVQIVFFKGPPPGRKGPIFFFIAEKTGATTSYGEPL